jgi:hypothetical protein
VSIERGAVVTVTECAIRLRRLPVVDDESHLGCAEDPREAAPSTQRDQPTGHQHRARGQEMYAFTVFERAFKDFGLPASIRTDNGVPFASRSAFFGLSKLSMLWLRFGIGIERIKRGHPQQNGRHERIGGHEVRQDYGFNWRQSLIKSFKRTGVRVNFDPPLGRRGRDPRLRAFGPGRISLNILQLVRAYTLEPAHLA